MWPGSYGILEVMPDWSWQATDWISLTLSGDESLELLLGDRHMDETSFKDKGFWHNASGSALINAEDIEALNALEPFASDTGSWACPFDGTWVETGRAYSGTGAVGEISDFLGMQGTGAPLSERVKLTQQLCAFVLNVRHYTPGYGTYSDVGLRLADGTDRVAGRLVGEAVEAWRSGDEQWCSQIRQLLQRYNRAQSIQMGVIAIDPWPW